MLRSSVPSDGPDCQNASRFISRQSLLSAFLVFLISPLTQFLKLVKLCGHEPGLGLYRPVAGGTRTGISRNCVARGNSGAIGIDCVARTSRMTRPDGVIPRVITQKRPRNMRPSSDRPANAGRPAIADPLAIADQPLETQSLSQFAEVVQLSELPPVACPCGIARRAFTHRNDLNASVHLTEIRQSARTHYHRHLTETYVVLECESDAAIELDGRLVPVRPLSSVLIPPGVRHRAVGDMRVIIFCTPTFDPADEHFD